MDATFVIPTYGSRRSLAACLEALLAQRTSLLYEIIVVDSSPDEALRAFESRYPQVIFLKESARMFPGVARNRGADVARGEMLFFVDSDVIVPPDALEKAHQFFKEGHGLFTYAIDLTRGAAENLPSRFEWFIEFSEFKPLMPRSRRWCLPAYAMIVSRGFFQTCRFADLEFAEDSDLSLRMEKLGAELLFYPGICVRHDSMPTWGGLIKKLYRHAGFHAKLRKLHEVSGSRLLRNPVLALLAVPVFALVKYGKLSWRNLRYNRFADAALYALATPLMLFFMLVWVLGFYAGLRSET